jgi:hypothetical protein
MKILKFLVIPIFMMLVFFSCKKDNSQNPINDEEVLAFKKGVSVSSRGYLVFNTAEDIVKFAKLLVIDNDDKLLTELKGDGFKSRKANQTDLSRDPNSIYSSIFNAQGLLQVNDVIMKITDDDLFLYTLLQQYADATTMNNLINEVYDLTKMNKIKVDRELTENFSLIDFTAANPYGRLEALNGGTAGRRPMFGSVSSTSNIVPVGSGHYNTGTGSCVQWICNVTTTTTYVFWINVGHNTEYNGCHEVGVAPINCN